MEKTKYSIIDVPDVATYENNSFGSVVTLDSIKKDMDGFADSLHRNIPSLVKNSPTLTAHPNKKPSLDSQILNAIMVSDKHSFNDRSVVVKESKPVR